MKKTKFGPSQGQKRKKGIIILWVRILQKLPKLEIEMKINDKENAKRLEKLSTFSKASFHRESESLNLTLFDFFESPKVKIGRSFIQEIFLGKKDQV